MLAVAGTLALAACAAEGEVAPGERLAQLRGATASAEGLSHYIAFGDSFVSGIGASDVTWEPCGTSPAAWPYGVQAELGIPDLIFAACSGATTEDIGGTGRLQMQSQMSQLPSPEALDSALITIAIGGNDLKLDDRLKNCFQGGLSSSLPGSCEDLEQLLDTAEEVTNDALAPSLEYTFRVLRAAAPNATIAAVGYPHVVDASGAYCDLTVTGLLINRANRQKLNDLIDAVNAQIKAAAAKAGIVSIVDEVVEAFEGHEACSRSEWIVSADTFLRTGNFGISHPNDVGYRVYADAVVSGLLNVTRH